MIYTFDIDGPPFGKPAISQTAKGLRYRSREVSAYYGKVAWLARGALGFRHSAAPVIVITAIKARPKRKPQDYPLQWGSKRNPCLATPDADNIAKCVLDGLKYAKAFDDDCRVSGLTVWTFYAAEGEGPHVIVEVLDLAQQSKNVSTNRGNYGDTDTKTTG